MSQKLLKENEPLLIDEGLTQFIIPSPDKYNTDDPTESWRKYYIDEKQKMAQWGKRGNPYWFTVLTQNTAHENNQENKKILQVKKGTKTKAKEKFKDAQKYLAWAKSYASQFESVTNRLQNHDDVPLTMNKNISRAAINSVSSSYYAAAYAVKSLLILYKAPMTFVAPYAIPSSIEEGIIKLKKHDSTVYNALLKHLTNAKYLDALYYTIRRYLKENAHYSGALIYLEDNPDAFFLDALRSALVLFQRSRFIHEMEVLYVSEYLDKQIKIDLLTYADCVKLSINTANDIFASVDNFVY